MANYDKQTKPYGHWEATINEKMVVSKSLRFGTLKTDGHYLYWCEQRPDEAGRGVLMRWCQETGLSEILKAPYSARSKVHEYGGGEYCVADGKIFFVNAADQQIYWVTPGNEPHKITNAPNFRFADLTYDSARDRLIAISEKHEEHKINDKEHHHLPQNMLVNIGLSGNEEGGVSILDDSNDFYSSPVISQDHNNLAWLQWNLSNMPWEAAELMVSPLTNPSLSPVHIAGGNHNDELNSSSACFQPEWDKNGALYFINDQSGTGQLYYWKNGNIETVQGQDTTADCLRPQWVFGMGAFCQSNNGRLYLASTLNGVSLLQRLGDAEDEDDGEPGNKIIETEARSVETPVICASNLAAIITSDQQSPSIGLIDKCTGDLTIIRAGNDIDLSNEDISIGQLKKFTSPTGQTYALYYPPANKEYMAPENTLPPAIITVHGGPTAMADRGLKLKTQFWTNKGFAVFDVDYSGSSGYGKSYRERLDGTWGENDVEDVIAAANFLIDNKLADPEKLIISGGSAGGYTCLMALIKSQVFKCASCNYPVTDLSQLLEITHKFELGYTYRLTGTTQENAKQKLQQKSVISQIEKINSPVIFFQGNEDKVVPPSQPQAVYEKLKSNNITTKMFIFENEGHGFRRADTISKVLQEESEFFKNVLGL